MNLLLVFMLKLFHYVEPFSTNDERVGAFLLKIVNVLTHSLL